MKNHTPLLILLLLHVWLGALPAHAILLSHLRLINAETDEPISGYEPIAYEAVIDLAALPTRDINIEAVLNSAFSAGSVRFIEFGRSQVKIDNTAPHAFGAEAEGDFEGMELHLGNYEFTTVAYTEADGGGTPRETVDGRNDLANDCYVRVEGAYAAGPAPYSSHGDNAPLATLQRNTEFFGGDHLNFVWASGNRLDLGGDTNKRVAVYDFKAGEEYTLVVSGRSQLFRLDRIIFRHTEVASSTAENRSVPESSFVVEGAEQWGGYALEEGKFINTGDWLGYLSVEFAPYVYSFTLSSWIYVEEEWLTDKGFWSFTFK